MISPPSSAASTTSVRKPIAMRSSVRPVVLSFVVLASVACSKGSAAPPQRGIPAGSVIVGYMASTKPSSADECVVVTMPAAERATMNDAKLAELAKLFGAQVAKGCPLEKVVGTCNVMKGMLVNYSSPTHTVDTAKAACTKDRGTWVE